MNRWRLCLAIVGSALGLLAQGNQKPEDLEAVVTTEAGVFRIEFAADKAPKHVELFLKNARSGYYNGSGFHRVFANAVIQGGDPLLKDPKTPKKLWGSGGLSLVPDEFSDFKHERGVVSSVSIPGRPNSEGAQFFVCLTAQPALDGKYSTFGRVTEGMDVVEKISLTPAGEGGAVETPVRILSVTIEPKKREPFATASLEQLHRRVHMETTLGAMTIEMHPEWAPETVRNFLKLAVSGWYDRTSFFRISKGFVVQGGMGDNRLDAATKAPRPIHPGDRWVRDIKGEFAPGVKHGKGTVSMARGDDPDSASTSFFLVLAPSPHLDGKYAAFAQVVEGLEVLDAYEKEPVDGEAPKRRLEVISITLEEASRPKP